jgi:hypothetical protein
MKGYQGKIIYGSYTKCRNLNLLDERYQRLLVESYAGKG